MKVTLPKTVSLPGEEKKPKKEQRKPIPLGFTGHVVLPDSWNGGDFEDFYKASLPDEKETIWEREWVWTKAHIKEWAIKDLSTNPNEIKDNVDLTWALMSFLSMAAIKAMNDYMKKGVEEMKDLIDYPNPANLRPGEFFTWHKAMREASKEEETSSNLKNSWTSGSLLVREWPNGGKPKTYRSADLILMLAVDELLTETLIPSLNLGNWSAPLGEA